MMTIDHYQPSFKIYSRENKFKLQIIWKICALSFPFKLTGIPPAYDL